MNDCVGGVVRLQLRFCQRTGVKVMAFRLDLAGSSSTRETLTLCLPGLEKRMMPVMR